MKLSQQAFKPLRNAPNDADTVNHKYLVQAGYVRQVMAGVYDYLPLGLRTLNKVRNIIREEMNAIGSQELLMPLLHPSELWKTTKAWDNVDVLFKLNSRTKKEYALSQSHEETVTPLMKEVIKSYRDLPQSVYQIQWKFRDELRAKSGIMRGREFEMKDMYSFHETQEDFERYYEIVKQAYIKAFKRCGLTAKATEASGGSFTEKLSYEFMVLTDAGEDDIVYCSACDHCANVEVSKQTEGEDCPKCHGSKLAKARASEVGNVFDLGQKYVKDFDVTFMDRNGEKKYPVMGCYGWGVTRTMGVIVEKFNDEKGILWPNEVAPFHVHLISLTGGEQKAEELYNKLNELGIEVLWDDRDETAGTKFADADLIGNPVRLVVSQKTGDQVEWKRRSESQSVLLDVDEVFARLQ